MLSVSTRSMRHATMACIVVIFHATMIAYFHVLVFNMSNFLTKKTTASILLSLFWVVFMWGFWTRGVFALGVNFAVYLVALILFFVAILKSEQRYQNRDLGWIIPMFMLAMSFAIYENPFFKIFCLLVIPPTFALFYNFAWLDDKWNARWNIGFLGKMLEKILSALVYIKEAIISFFNIIPTTSSSIVKRVLVGLVILIIALFIIIPLLSSADAVFGSKLGAIVDLIKNIVSA